MLTVRDQAIFWPTPGRASSSLSPTYAATPRRRSGECFDVISGSTRVSEDARRKALDAIRVLKYQPNLIARSLRIHPYRDPRYCGSRPHHPLLPHKIVRGAGYAARERGYS